MVIIIALLLLTSLFFECYGFIFRLLGAINKSPTLGYSLHVQVATIARFGTLLAFPLIALQIETGISNNTLIIIPIITYSCLSVMLLILSKSPNLNNWLLYHLLVLLSRFSGLDKKIFKISILKAEKKLLITRNERNKIVYFGTAAFLFTSSAFFVTSIVANEYLDYRSTIIQCTPFISSIGTLMSVIYFDPTLSQLIDKNPESIMIIKLAWKARIYGSLVIASLFLIFLTIL